MNLLENILKRNYKVFLLTYLTLFFYSIEIFAKEKWVIDSNISYIKFELPVLFAENVKGDFKKIDGLVEIDLDNKSNNKAIFTVDINSIEINYKKYLDLVLSETFFNSSKYPLSLIDTKKFKYQEEQEILLPVELSIKGKSKIIPINLQINKLSNDLVQIITKFDFSRTEYEVGKGKWRNTAILKDRISIDANIFLFKE